MSVSVDSTVVLKGLPARAGLFAFLVSIIFSLTACKRQSEIFELGGLTMGTGYSIQIAGSHDAKTLEALQTSIEDELLYLDKVVFSTWSVESQVSLFNNMGLSEPMNVSKELIEVLAVAAEVSELSEGAFDPTVAPLVNLWGFGPGNPAAVIPDEDRIYIVLQQVGLDAVTRGPGHILAKTKPRQLDFSGVAKGFAADRLGVILEDAGIDDYLVEIGGEILANGWRGENQDWQIALEAPATGQRKAVIVIGNKGQRMAVAGSGTYRNFFEIEGARYSHEIDPRTGYPAQNDLLSATVVHNNAASADAWATAFMILGPEEAARIADKQNIALFLQIADQGITETSVNRHFSALIDE